MEACREGQNTLLSSTAQLLTLTGLESSLESKGSANTTDSTQLQSVLAVNGPMNDVGDGLWRCMHMCVCGW